MAKYYDSVRKALRAAIEGRPKELLFLDLYAAFDQMAPGIDVQRRLENLWVSQVVKERILANNKGVTSFTLASVRPQLRDELDRRILASADLIKLNKKRAVETTVQRFEGWLSSLPAVPEVRMGQMDEVPDAVRHIIKPLKQLPFEERRVAIDQGHKLVANLNQIVAYDAGAIGAYWHSHWKEINYDYRPEHKSIDKHFYLIRDSKAMRDGFVKKGGHEYIDELPDQPGELIYCRCYMEYVYRLNRIPEECLTEKGKNAIGQ